jgi:hypothetical protein
MHWIDPQFLPETTGYFERFVTSPDGDIDGLVMQANGVSLLVHLPPHMHHDVEAAIRAGDSIRVRGIRPRGADVLAAVCIVAADGSVLRDDGPDREEKKRGNDNAVNNDKGDNIERIEALGVVRLSLFGPKGELRGALLDDGTVVRVGAKHAKQFVDLLKPNVTISVVGKGFANRHGLVVAAQEIGDSNAARVPIKEHKPKEPHASSQERVV